MSRTEVLMRATSLEQRKEGSREFLDSAVQADRGCSVLSGVERDVRPVDWSRPSSTICSPPTLAAISMP
jgi:hypothetical protein